MFFWFILCVLVLINWCFGKWQWKKEMEALQDVPPGYDPVMEAKPKSKAAKRNERKKEKRQQVQISSPSLIISCLLLLCFSQLCFSYERVSLYGLNSLLGKYLPVPVHPAKVKGHQGLMSVNVMAYGFIRTQ